MLRLSVIALPLQVEVEVSVQDSAPCPRAMLANAVLMMNLAGQQIGQYTEWWDLNSSRNVHLLPT